MNTFKPKHQPGQKLGRVLIHATGPLRKEAPDLSKTYKRKQWWYSVRCDCGAPVYWVSQDQLRTHRECNACARKRRIVRPEAMRQVEPPPVDFLRMRLVSKEMRELMNGNFRTRQHANAQLSGAEGVRLDRLVRLEELYGQCNRRRDRGTPAADYSRGLDTRA